MATFEFDVTIKFEAKDKEHASTRADKICKLLESGAPANALKELDIEASFSKVHNLREIEE